MKAVVYSKYGTPDVLEVKEVEKPVPKDKEVLVKVKACSLNASDCEFLSGSPFYVRIWGLFKPGNQTLGSDVAGIVEAVGKDVTQFQIGDEVYGDLFEKWGGLAEYARAPEDKCLLKPSSLTFSEAAAIPQASTVALQGLRDKGDLQEGRQVLINGAGGGSGSFAIQLAKMFGGMVTAVDSGEKSDMMRSAGADFVIDYKKEDFTKNGNSYDLILDFVAAHSVFDYKQALKPGGRYVVVGGPLRRIFQIVFFGAWFSFTGDKKMGILGHRQNKKDLNYVTDLIESGELKVLIDQTYSLEETSAAFRHLSEGRVRGKVVITI